MAEASAPADESVGVGVHVGYVGLGAMGGALARRLLGALSLSVYDVDPSAVAALERAGATAAASPADLAGRCDVVLLCLPRSSDVQQALFGPGGLAEGLRPGQLVIDQTSGSPQDTRRMADALQARGVALIDAPVSGGVAGAAAGTITIMVSGPDEALARARPVLEAISPNLARCGSRVGDAQAMKLVNNVLSAGCRVATLEVVAMGRKMGLSLPAITEAINLGSGRNRTSRVMLRGLAEGKPAISSFAMALMVKDLDQALALGMSCDAPMALTQIVRGLLQIGVNTLGPGAQLDQVLGLVESMAGATIAEPVPPESPAPPPHTPDPTASKVGYVGLGAMGGALARRLMHSRPLQVFDVRPEVVAEFAAAGAEPATDLAALARACDVILLCVPTSEQVREVLFGRDGEGGGDCLARGLGPGKIVVDQTTGDPALTREFAARLQAAGVALVDAPVSGGPRGAVAGTIAILCGGAAPAFGRVRPIFEQISPNIAYCGGVGNGHVGKLVNNSVAACNRMLTYEAAALGVKAGLKLADLDAVINGSTGWNGASERILPVLGRHGQTAQFQLRLMVKDLRLAARMAAGCGAPMLVANAVCTLYEVAAHELGGGANLDELAHQFEKTAKVDFAGA